MTNCGPTMPFGLIESMPHGVEEATPMNPLVAKVVEAMTDVEDAKMPDSAQSVVVVAAVVVPNTVKKLNGDAPET